MFPLEPFAYEKIKGFFSSVWIADVVSAFFNVLVDGELAVYIFWFMSAYVISIKLFKINSIAYIKSVIAKRYFRLLIPAMGSILFAFGLLYFDLMHNSLLAEARPSNSWLGKFYDFQPDLPFAVASGFWHTFFDFNYRTTYNSVLWTMNPELYGSIICFIIFGIVRLHPKRFWLYFVLLLISIFILKKYWLSSFLIGFMLCDLDYAESSLQKHRMLIAKLLSRSLIYIPIIFLLILLRDNFRQHIMAVFISGSIVLLILNSGPLKKFFSQKIWVWLGKISFSFYLVHFPIICSFTCWLHLKLTFSIPLKFLIIGSSSLVLSLVTAWIFTKYVDRLSIIVSNRIGRLFINSKS